MPVTRRSSQRKSKSKESSATYKAASSPAKSKTKSTPKRRTPSRPKTPPVTSRSTKPPAPVSYRLPARKSPGPASFNAAKSIDETISNVARRAQDGYSSQQRSSSEYKSSYLDDVDVTSVPSRFSDSRRVHELRPCEDDGDLNGLISSIDVLQIYGNDPDTAKVTLKVAGVPQAEIERIAKEKGVMGLMQRVKKEYESCPVQNLNRESLNRVLAEISEQNIKVLKSARDLKAARQAASPEARSMYDRLLLEDYTGKPRRNALKVTTATIDANIAKTKRIKERVLEESATDAARNSLMEEKAMLDTAELSMAGSFDDFDRMSKVSKVLAELEAKREEAQRELMEEQARAISDTMFLEKDHTRLRERLAKIYTKYDGTPGSVPMFNIPAKNDRGVQVAKLVEGENMTEMARQMQLMHESFQNHKEQTNQCRVLLSRHGIDSDAKWKALMKKIGEEELDTDDLHLKFAPCLESAMWSYTMQMYEKTGELLDEHGVVPQGKFSGKGYSENFDKTMDYAHPEIYKFEPTSGEVGYQDMLKSYIDFVTLDQAERPLPDMVKQYIVTSRFGTGFRLSGGTFAPAPMAHMLNAMTGVFGDDEIKALFSEKGLGGIYDRLEARTGHEKAYDLLSAHAKSILHIRNSIKQRIKLKLGEIDHMQCPINRFVGAYIDSDAKKDVIGTYPFMEEASMWAKIEMGVPSTETAKKIFKSLATSLESVISDTPALDNTRGGRQSVIVTLFEVIDILLSTDVDCDAMLEKKMSKEGRQAFFESHMTGDTVYKHAGSMLEKMGCRVSALTLDRALKGPLKDIQEEIQDYAPLPLVDEVLLRFGLPTIQSRTSPLSTDIDSIATLKLDIDPEFDKLIDQTKRSLAAAFNIVGDIPTPVFQSIMSGIINAALALRDFKYSFELAKEPTTDEIWDILKEGRYLYKLKGGDGAYGEPDVVLTDISALRERQKDPNLVAEALRTVQEFFKGDFEESIRTQTDLFTETLADGTLKPNTAFGTYMEGYRGWAGRGNLILVLPETITYAFLDTVGARDPKQFNVIGLTDPDKENLIYTEMMNYAKQMITFDNIFKGGISNTEILRKQLRMIKKQAETLCNLPESECKASRECVFAKSVQGKGVCLVRGRQEITKDEGAPDSTVKWIRPEMQFSKTKVLISAAESGRKFDLVQIGWDDLKDKLMDPTNEAKKLYRGIKAADLLLDYIDSLHVGGAPARTQKDNNKVIFHTLDGLVASAKRQIEFMERLRMDPDSLCRGIHKVIKKINAMVQDMERKDENYWDDPKSVEEMTATMKGFTSLFLEDPTASRNVADPFEVSDDDVYLSIPPPLVHSILCRLIHSIYTLNNQIRSINCNLNADECKANSKSGGMCVWRSETCMNPAIHKLKAFSSAAGALGIVHRVLVPEFRSMLMGSKGPDGYSPEDIPAVERILAAVFGEEITSIKYMNRFDRERKLEQLTEYDKKNLPKEYNSALYGGGSPTVASLI